MDPLTLFEADAAHFKSMGQIAKRCMVQCDQEADKDGAYFFWKGRMETWLEAERSIRRSIDAWKNRASL